MDDQIWERVKIMKTARLSLTTEYIIQTPLTILHFPLCNPGKLGFPVSVK